MNSEKVKEIKEKLQEEIFIANSFGDKLRKVPTKELENLLTLINELESENGNLILENQALKNRIVELEKKIENGTLVELGYHIRKSYRNHDDQRYKIILIDEVEIDKIGYDGLTKSEAEARLKKLQEELTNE